MRILVLVTDAFGGFGGIAKFNRDLLTALCAAQDVEEVVAVPRLMPEPPGALPTKLNYVTSGVGSKMRYIKTLLTTVLRLPTADLLICGHINLLPVALAARLFCRAPVALVSHGIDAWQPTRSWLVNRLVRRINALISVSEFTKQQFLGWARLVGVRTFILPNCIELAAFRPGPKNSQLLDRYCLRDRTVLLTVARLSAQERYKGVDRVMEVLPDLAKEIPSLCYLVVGDGTDRERLMNKAQSLGLSVTDYARANSSPSPPRSRRGLSEVSKPDSPTLHTPHPTLNPAQVIFAGRIPEDEKVDHYRMADAFVMPGWGEGFGIVYLEAMACGIPVVASKADASREVVGDGKLGFIVDPRNPAEIREGVLAALKRPRGFVSASLNDFSFKSFQTRVHEIVERLVPRLEALSPPKATAASSIQQN